MELQKDRKNLSHYLDGVQGGCNEQLEKKIRFVIFEIIQKLCKRLSVTKDPEEGYTLLYALQW